jgi:ubiquitin C-terminal hydrolase
MLKTKISRITRGMRNCGGITCYFNSSMQLFFNIEEIQNYFYNYIYYNENEYNKLKNNEKELILILNNLKRIYKIIFRDKDPIQNTISNDEYDKLIKDTVQKIFVDVDITKQQESFEILIQIFTKFDFDFDNNDLSKFKDTLLPLINNQVLFKRTYDKNKYNCNDIINIKSEYNNYVPIKYENINMILKKTNFIDEIFKIFIENNTEWICDSPKYINGNINKIDKMQIKSCYNIQTKYIIINFVPYIDHVSGVIINYGTIELDKSFSVNNINYKIKGIVIHTGSVNGGHYYYYHFENDICKKYDDINVVDNYILLESTEKDKYIFNENEHPVVIIYEKKDNINPSKKFDFECFNKIDRLKILIDKHFSRLKKLDK